MASSHTLTAERTAVVESAHPATDPFLVKVGSLVAAIFLVLDQATKELSELQLFRARMMDANGNGWGWQLTYNDGGAFGFPAPWWFFLIVTVVVAVIVVRNLPRTQTPSAAIAYGLLLAGALGNAFDRVVGKGPGDPGVLRGEVVDFIAIRLPIYGDFPRFNVADVAITAGFILLIIAMWAEERALEEAEREAERRAELAGGESPSRSPLA